MVRFFEPEEQYKFEQGKKSDIKARISLLTSLIIFGSLPIIAVQFDVLKVYGDNKISEYCLEGDNYDRVEQENIATSKALKVLENHIETIQELDGFVNSSMVLEAIGKERKKPFLKFVFKKNSNGAKRIPEKICEFETIIIKEN